MRVGRRPAGAATEPGVTFGRSSTGYVRQDIGAISTPEDSSMRIGGIIVVIWLVIGLLAAAQRDYFSGSDANCAKVGTVLVTVIAGPLNYIGANPKIECHTPKPSK